MDRFDPFVKYADVYGDIINWEKDPMNKPQNQNKYFFSDGKTYYEQICKMLRLMSVFKEAFNQIYNNEDEISGAWENFVNNLSASVVEGSEPDVTLTWTDDSVNFEFTMVPGVPGDPGVGITSISFNSDYTMTITLSDGSTYTSMSLKGDTGPQGPQGETGSGLQILDVYATLADLQSAHPTGQPGDAYQVGSAGNYTLYIWSSSQSAWVPAGSLGTVSPSVSNPLMDGTASAGSSNLYSRGDHVHPSDTSRASKEELDALIKTSQSLIDQSFTYRESPAIQDGLARIDKIKGNTLVWNQLVQNGNFADDSVWSHIRGTLTAQNNVGTYEVTEVGNSNSTNRIAQSAPIKANHKYAFIGYFMGSKDEMRIIVSKETTSQYFIPSTALPSANTWYKIFGTGTPATDGNVLAIRYTNVYQIGEIGDKLYFKNLMFIDLTQLGIDSLTDSEIEQWFASLFSLPYYDYNTGTLLSFNGTGLKSASEDESKEDTLSLPVSTYFPNGMASAKNVNNNTIVYDELTEDKAIKRLEQYTFTGNETISGITNLGTYYRCYITLPIPSKGTYATKWEKNVPNVYNYTDDNSHYYVQNSQFWYFTTASTAEAIMAELTGTKFYYDLATPVETAVDLDMSFISYLDGTEQLLPVNGPSPVTSPIIADMSYLSIDDAMTYILEKLESIPEQTEQRLESLEDDVADLQEDVGALQPAVSALQTSVGNINTNIGQLSSTVAGHTSSISDMQSDITDLNTGLNDLNTGLNDLEDTVTDNTSRIGTLETGLTNTDSQIDAIDARVLNLETDLLIVVKKEYDYDSVAGNTNFGVQTGLSQEPGYKIIGIVGSEVQQGEYTSAEPWIIVTQAHVHYTSTGGVVLSMMARNVSEYTKTNVRVYLYLLCIKDTQSQ